jgi:uncharacterized delta-60 repeat protein
VVRLPRDGFQFVFWLSLFYFAGVFRARGGLAVVAALAGLLAGAAAAQAAPGDLDTSFGQAGIATIVLPHNAFAQALVVQPDGKTVVAGNAISASGQTTDVVTARFTQAGAPDTAYGIAGNGVAQPDFGANETGYAAALQPDGKILVAGDSDEDRGMTRPLVTRFNANGTLDTSFGGGAGWSSPLAGSDFPDIFGRAIALKPDGTIVVGGYVDYSPNAPIIEAISSTGTDEAERLQDDYTKAGTLAGMAVAEDGSVETVGETQASTAPPAGVTGNFEISNVTENGFGSISQDLGGTDVATAVAVQPDGKFVVAGATNVGGTYNFAVSRYNTNQTLDTSFGNGGTESVDLGGSDTATSLVVQPNGKIVVAGTSMTGSHDQIGVVRLLSNGQPDTGFGKNGVVLVGTAGADLEGNAVGLEPDGDIVIAGVLHPNGGTVHNMLVVRLQGDAGVSPSGGGAGGGSGPGSGAPSTPGLPTLSGLTSSKKQFHEGRSLPKLNPTGHPSGLVLSVSLSEAAKVTLQFLKPAPGRLANGHCSAPNKSNKSARHCTRHIAVGSVSFQANAGLNTVAFSGRLTPSKKLKPGAYTVAVTASAANGTSTVSKLAITILP